MSLWDSDCLMLSEVSHAEKDKYCRISLIWNLKKKKSCRNKDQICGCQRLGVGSRRIGRRWSKVQTPSCKMSMSWACIIVQHGNEGSRGRKTRGSWQNRVPGGPRLSGSSSTSLLGALGECLPLLPPVPHL